MFTGTLYESVKSELDKYLFGFEKSQLDCSVFTGEINLKGVNLKPDKASQFVQTLGLPFQIKAGTIGNLQVKLNYFQIFQKSSNPMEITINDLYIIVGPNMMQRSNDESFSSHEQDLIAPYDQGNMFHIRENTLTVKNQNAKKYQGNQLHSNSLGTDDKDSSISDETLEMVRSFHLVIRRLHLRYEDDYFAEQGKPYSFGLLVDELRCFTSNEQTEASVSKKIQIKGMRVYWNSFSEMFIPTTLWEQTQDLKYQIFDAMEASQLAQMMANSFKTEKQFLVQNFDTEVDITLGANNLDISVICSSIDIQITPQTINEMNNFIQQSSTYYLMRDLKQYRPHRRPITADDITIPGLEKNKVFMHKRKLIVRDWFFFVVWSIRLKNILKQVYKSNDDQYYLFSSKYQQMLKMAFDRDVEFEKFRLKFTEREDERKLKNYLTKIQFKQLVLRVQGDQAQSTQFEIQCTNCSLTMQRNANRTDKSVNFETFKLFLITQPSLLFKNNQTNSGKPLPPLKVMLQSEIVDLNNVLVEEDNLVVNRHFPNVTQPGRLMTPGSSLPLNQRQFEGPPQKQRQSPSVIGNLNSLNYQYDFQFQQISIQTGIQNKNISVAHPKEFVKKQSLSSLINPGNQAQRRQPSATYVQIQQRQSFAAFETEYTNDQSQLQNCRISEQFDTTNNVQQIEVQNKFTKHLIAQIVTSKNTPAISLQLTTEQLSSQEVKLVCKAGSIQIQYSHSLLRHLYDLLVNMKQQSVFRDIDFCSVPQYKVPNLQLAIQKLSQGNSSSGQIQKITFFQNQLKSCNFNISIQAERVYISLFSEEQHQVAKFISPPVLLSLYKSEKDIAMNVMGFQFQQTTDINLISRFSQILTTQIKMFTENDALKKGKQFYKNLVLQHKQKHHKSVYGQGKPPQMIKQAKKNDFGMIKIQQQKYQKLAKQKSQFITLNSDRSQMVKPQGMIKQLELNEIPSKKLCREEMVQNPDSFDNSNDQISQKTESLKLCRSQSILKAKLQMQQTNSENDSGGAICYEDMANVHQKDESSSSGDLSELNEQNEQLSVARPYYSGQATPMIFARGMVNVNKIPMFNQQNKFDQLSKPKKFQNSTPVLKPKIPQKPTKFQKKVQGNGFFSSSQSLLKIATQKKDVNN